MAFLVRLNHEKMAKEAYFLAYIKLCQINVIPLLSKPYVNEVTLRDKNDPYNSASLLIFDVPP